MEHLKINYVFDFNSPQKINYELEFDEKTMSYVTPSSKEPAPDWTNLEFNKCSHCPLNSTQNPQCPIALNLSRVASHFKNEKSFRETTVGVITRERNYIKKLSLQEGLFSIFGLIMATSGCPHMNFLKPMARFHLPFSTQMETTVRSLSMFLLRQHILERKTKDAPPQNEHLEELYANVTKVNVGVIGRIRTVVKGDANLNALIILDNFATVLSSGMRDSLEEIQALFFP